MIQPELKPPSFAVVTSRGRKMALKLWGTQWRSRGKEWRSLGHNGGAGGHTNLSSQLKPQDSHSSCDKTMSRMTCSSVKSPLPHNQPRYVRSAVDVAKLGHNAQIPSNNSYSMNSSNNSYCINSSNNSYSINSSNDSFKPGAQNQGALFRSMTPAGSWRPTPGPHRRPSPV